MSQPHLRILNFKLCLKELLERARKLDSTKLPAIEFVEAADKLEEARGVAAEARKTLTQAEKDGISKKKAIFLGRQDF